MEGLRPEIIAAKYWGVGAWPIIGEPPRPPKAPPLDPNAYNLMAAQQNFLQQ